MKVTDRDYRVLQELERWRFCLGRHIKVLDGFDGVRACDRRLRALLDAGYIERHKVLYGVPSLYMLAYKGKILIGSNARREKIRVAQIAHDIAVLDTAIYVMQEYKVHSSDIVSEKELHKTDGFGVRKHQPDFIFASQGQSFCVEVELSLKAKATLLKNIADNYLQYDRQIWVIPSTQQKVKDIVSESMNQYTGTIILEWETVRPC